MANYEGTGLFIETCNMIRKIGGNNAALLICHAPITFKLKTVDL